MPIAALVLGIIGLFFAVTGCLWWLGVILGILAVIFGIIGRSNPVGSGKAKAGLIMGGISMVIGLAWLVVGLVFGPKIADFMVKAVKDAEQQQRQQQQQQQQAPKGGGVPDETPAAPPGK